MGKIPIGLQVYSVREEAEKDLPGTLAAIAKMGYDGVDFAGYYGYSAADVRKMLDDTGLKCCGGHLGINTLTGDELARTIEYQATLGNQYLVCPGLPGDFTNSRAAWTRTAGVFNDIAAKLAPHGMVTGYHNHHTEFTALDGELPWDTFASNTGAGVVLQLDMGNGLFGGADLVGLLRKYPGRSGTVHLKPFKLGLEGHAGFRPLIGDDDVPWAQVFDICETTGGTKWYIVEYESDAFPPLEAVDKCLQKLRGMGK
jgi:sugar phosphate isomerase/epimerase